MKDHTRQLSIEDKKAIVKLALELGETPIICRWKCDYKDEGCSTCYNPEVYRTHFKANLWDRICCKHLEQMSRIQVVEKDV